MLQQQSIVFLNWVLHVELHCSMMTSGSSGSSRTESPESGRRRYMNASLSEVSDPEEWMGLHDHEEYEEIEVDEEVPSAAV